MIQRIQSIYLVAAFVLLEVAAWLSYSTSEAVPDPYGVVFGILLGVGGLCGLGAVFLFKTRDLQAKLVRWLELAIGLLIVALLVMAYFLGTTSKLVSGDVSDAATLQLLASIAAIVLLALAGKAIKRDIDLIRSMDRLR